MEHNLLTRMKAVPDHCLSETQIQILVGSLLLNTGVTFGGLQAEGWDDVSLFSAARVLSRLEVDGLLVRRLALLETFGDTVSCLGEFADYSSIRVPDGTVSMLVMSVFYLGEGNGDTQVKH